MATVLFKMQVFGQLKYIAGQRLAGGLLNRRGGTGTSTGRASVPARRHRLEVGMIMANLELKCVEVVA